MKYKLCRSFVLTTRDVFEHEFGALEFFRACAMALRVEIDGTVEARLEKK
jgi:hypothetical protein